MLTLQTVHDRLAPHAGTTHLCPLTANKGVAGFLVETLAGIPQTSNCLDCIDGEVKCFPLKRLASGLLVPKETVAVTMIQPTSLATTPFAASNAYRKLANCLYIPYLRTGDTIQLFKPVILTIPESDPLFATLKADYDAIVSAYVASATLSGTTGLGTYLQNRTKGAKSSTSRAFYLRTGFLKEVVMPVCLP
jgi:DNA mismatch repair protein MutH